MLSRFEVQHYKSLYDVKVDLEPLTVFIGPNGSEKSNICEALAVLAKLFEIFQQEHSIVVSEALAQVIKEVTHRDDPQSKFWQGMAYDYRIPNQVKKSWRVKNSRSSKTVSPIIANRPLVRSA